MSSGAPAPASSHSAPSAQGTNGGPAAGRLDSPAEVARCRDPHTAPAVHAEHHSGMGAPTDTPGGHVSQVDDPMEGDEEVAPAVVGAMGSSRTCDGPRAAAHAETASADGAPRTVPGDADDGQAMLEGLFSTTAQRAGLLNPALGGRSLSAAAVTAAVGAAARDGAAGGERDAAQARGCGEGPVVGGVAETGKAAASVPTQGVAGAGAAALGLAPHTSLQRLMEQGGSQSPLRAAEAAAGSGGASSTCMWPACVVDSHLHRCTHAYCSSCMQECIASMLSSCSCSVDRTRESAVLSIFRLLGCFLHVQECPIYTKPYRANEH